MSDCDMNLEAGEIPTGTPGTSVVSTTSGPAGADGADGINAFTVTTATFTVPAVNSTTSITVGSTAWMAVGEPLFITTAGAYRVVSLIDDVTVSVRNLGLTGNAAASTVISIGSVVTPSGEVGTAGADGSGGSGSSLTQIAGRVSLADSDTSKTVSLATSFFTPVVNVDLYIPSGGDGISCWVSARSSTSFTAAFGAAISGSSCELHYTVSEAST